MRVLVFVFLGWCVALQAQPDPFHYSIHKSGAFKKAAVSSAHPLASEVGLLMMKKGGNAFDAAVATQLALSVVYPSAGNIGGGGFMLARRQNGGLVALDYRERAPERATEAMYLDSNGNVNSEASLNGRLAVGVPGTVAGIFATLKYCRLPFSVLVKPAIALARSGFAITAAQADDLNEHRDDFIRYNSKPVAFVRSKRWQAGDTLVQPQLAATLERIERNGRKAFYEGETARLIVEEMKRGGGIITAADLKAYTAKERVPITFKYRGYDVIGFPPPSSGGILLAQMLKMSERFPLGQYGFQSLHAVQLMTEVERRAYADRAEHLGDPDFFFVPTATLISDQYLAGRMRDYDSTHAGSSAKTKAGRIRESPQTTHISIMDADGNMVSVTTTLNGGYGSRTVVADAGFLLNNEMDDFSAKPGAPNLYGAVGGKVNAIAPGKRMLSSMAPTLVLKNNRPFLVAGTPGGTTIPTSVFQTIVNIVDFKMDVVQAVNRPKFHHQWLPDQIDVEPGFDGNAREGLLKMGYQVNEVSSLGRMEVIEAEDGLLQVCGDRRGDDSVAGY